MIVRTLATLAAFAVVAGTPTVAEAHGKHKGWTTATVCTQVGLPTLMFAGSAGNIACPVGYENATIVRVHKR